jgi:hypothetical protein
MMMETETFSETLDKNSIFASPRGIQRGVLFCAMCVICVLCVIVVPLPPGKTPFAVKINNNNISRFLLLKYILYVHMYFYVCKITYLQTY